MTPHRIGILPAVGNGLVHWERSGQLGRVCCHFRAYREAADDLLLVSYLRAPEEATAWQRWQREVGPTVPVWRDGSRLPPLLNALTLPLRHARAFRRCSVLRATSLLGALPALTAHLVWGTPFAVTVGADYAAIARLHGRDRQIWRYRWLWGAVIRSAGVVFVSNGSLAARLRAPLPPRLARKIVHLPNWVDTDRFRPRLQHYRRGPTPTVLYVGRLTREKNLPRLALACRIAGSRLLCVGDGPMQGAVEAEGGHCAGVQPWERLPGWHASVHAFALVSLSEGHPKALAEAMASGLPCLVSDRVEEGVEPGWNALVCGAEDEADMAMGVEEVLRPEAWLLGLRARETAVARWDKRRILAAEVAALRSLSGAGGG